LKSNKEIGIGEKIGMTLFGSIFLGIACVINVYAVIMVIDVYKTQYWPKTVAVIKSGKIIYPEREGKSYAYDLTFEFSYDSQTFLCKNITASGARGGLERVNRWSEEYPVGKSVECYVNVEKPTESILEHGYVHIPITAIVLLLVNIGFGGFGVFAIRLAWKSEQFKTVEQLERAKYLKVLVGLYVLSGLFVITATAGTYFIIIVPRNELTASMLWDEVECSIASSRVETRKSTSSDRSTTYSYSPDIAYAFLYQGRERSSNKYMFGNTSFSKKSQAESLISRYPKGTRLSCFVNPVNPSESILVRQIAGSMTGKVIWCVVFCMAGYGGLIATYMFSRSKHSKKNVCSQHNRNMFEDSRVISCPLCEEALSCSELNIGENNCPYCCGHFNVEE